MKRTRILLPSLATVVALCASPAAWALSCDEIMNMVEVNVPENIVVATVKDSGDQFSADEVQCLEDADIDLYMPPAAGCSATHVSGDGEMTPPTGFAAFVLLSLIATRRRKTKQ